MTLGEGHAVHAMYPEYVSRRLELTGEITVKIVKSKTADGELEFQPFAMDVTLKVSPPYIFAYFFVLYT